MRSCAELADLSMKMAMDGDRDGWLALYAEDATVEDPVGCSVWDPTGQGHTGKKAIAEFWDRAIGPNRGLNFRLRERYKGGEDELASVLTVSTPLADGNQYEFGMVTLLRRSPHGLIQRLRAFWKND